jgi:predicted membrane-bound dolichyl-phosphate-mannose-protein mannosyltransferase
LKKNRSQKIIFITLFFLCFAYLIRGIDKVPFPYWDEVLYVPAATAYLTSSKPFPVPDHPPLGKEFIALGIKLWGNGPLGWRFFSVVFGALACTLISYFVFCWTGNLSVSLFIAALLFLEPLFVVHFRMALLDPPLTCFMVLSTLLGFLFYRSPSPRWGLLLAAAAVLGLALATKFLALAIVPVLFGFVVFRLWREPQRWGKILAVSLGGAAVSVLVFFSSYWVLGYSTAEAWDLVKFIFAWHGSAKGPTPAMSRWYEWLFIKNPIWYYKIKGDVAPIPVVMVTGNFVLWIGAQLGALYCVFRLWRRPEIWMLLLAVAIQFFFYNRKPSTYLHYMTEILPFLFILLGVAMADLFARYGTRYRKLLLADFGVFFLGALLVFWNYWPSIWGRAVP